jgi:hypothetical protein
MPVWAIHVDIAVVYVHVCLYILICAASEIMGPDFSQRKHGALLDSSGDFPRIRAWTYVLQQSAVDSQSDGPNILTFGWRC